MLKKGAASRGPGSSEQGSAWLAVGAPFNCGSGHSTWLLIGDGLPAHSGGRVADVVIEQTWSACECRAEASV
jgi:hypothetical protein